MSSITFALLGPAARSGVASRVVSLSHDLAPTQIVLQRLVARIARVDEDALRQFRAVTTPQVSSSVRVLLTDPADVEEVLSDVILQVWRSARLYDPARGSVSRWLFLLVRSRAMDRRRQNAVAATAVRSDRGMRRWQAPPDELVDALQRKAALCRVVYRLSPLRQRVFTLALFGGLSDVTIAAATNLALGTVKSHIRRSGIFVRQELGRLG